MTPPNVRRHPWRLVDRGIWRRWERIVVFDHGWDTQHGPTVPWTRPGDS